MPTTSASASASASAPRQLLLLLLREPVNHTFEQRPPGLPKRVWSRRPRQHFPPVVDTERGLARVGCVNDLAQQRDPGRVCQVRTRRLGGQGLEGLG